MLLKAGVDISRLCRNCRRALNRIDAEFHDFVVTSTYEGGHSAGSLHYANQAFDIRITCEGREIDPNRLKDIVGEGFDVLREVTHFHIEWDPR